ncbi:MAG: lactonase family protein, partial [Anaerolineae bacterium]
DQRDGTLTLIGHESTRGKTPRNFVIDPTGEFLLAANQDSDNVVTFRINADSGELAATGHSVEVPTPVCVKVL